MSRLCFGFDTITPSPSEPIALAELERVGVRSKLPQAPEPYCQYKLYSLNIID
ncbi:MAG: hypothetical protein SFU91_07910 [Chloroherpetonaceae bacterium]|nr:hypothetical protein [Chloroherpetonaceae bacterium]